eukprot:gnl/Dysnectes_brevis/4343_a5788_1341.p1 GENE.gnl/Dysnectes_brevis/4343_a5788_1341~~gnl/Dysnectes_brevis/4343_a5788_1341.p1  ORF type:complete len:176 (+),score=19.86 gnl/Dysnectes_brevis/4343_a5788_1341:118-645(+)
MDGLVASDSLVFVLCATNLPWELDFALLRRLEKRIYVPPPSLADRANLIHRALEGRMGPDLTHEVVARVAGGADGFSGSDLTILAKEAAMLPVRRFIGMLDDDMNLKSSHQEGMTSKASQRLPSSISAEPPSTTLPDFNFTVTADDLSRALKVTNATADLRAVQYAQFQTRYGSG